MPEVLILCAHRPNRSPSQRYRFEQYLSFLESHGFRFTWSFLLDERQDLIFYSKGKFVKKVLILVRSLLKRTGDAFRFKKYDIVFIQREASFLGTAFFEKRAYRSGAGVIYDFDDSIWLADTSPGNKRWERVKRPEKFFEIVRNAHRVIAGNNYLAGKVKPLNNNVTVIPTTIDTSVHIPRPELRHKNTVVIGWSGSVSTIKHFEMLVPVLVRVKNKYGDLVEFRLLGDKNYKHAALGIEGIEWRAATEVDTLNTFDIGLMPLPDDAWTNGKCGLKALSYMACGVPAVVSAVGVNREIISDEPPNGFLAVNNEEWFDTLCRLIEDNVLRSNAGYRARETVLEKYSVEANKEKYLEVFKDSVKDQKIRPD
jgi:glycosyltransferase involved in cell wall biosynthesis